jgi:transcriptional regulator with GAF, ATPase, and Fis domain
MEAVSAADALETIRSEPELEVVVTERDLPDLIQEDFQALIHHISPSIEVTVVVTEDGFPTLQPTSTTIARSSINAARTVSIEHVSSDLCGAAADPLMAANGIIGNSRAMADVCALARLVSRRKTTVLLTGESGTGKDLVARAIHSLSTRNGRPFSVINCAALPETLLEAELFGYTKGSFTGAAQSRIGRIQAADGGTLFLDEIGDMPLVLQSKLLRFLENGEIQRLGSNENIKVDVRVIAATNVNLQASVAQKSFREDLLYRLAVFVIKLAPLRERLADIRLLATKFLNDFSPGITLQREALQSLCAYDWPGNVRELRNVMERASIMMGAEQELMVQHLYF